MSRNERPRYRGRFAPSPTGPLHIGSLLAAIASFLDAKANQGLWHLRIDDLDTPRNQSGATSRILRILESAALTWDGPVLFESRQIDRYYAAIEQLDAKDLLYFCTCSRKELSALAPDDTRFGIYPGICRNNKHPRSEDYATRIRTNDSRIGFNDRLQGYFEQNLAEEVGDFILRRRDRIFAYQLAVVIDDASQQVNQIVRGIDLIDSTPRQIYLHNLLGLSVPEYCHLPLVVDRDGYKLSKQNGARAVRESELSDVIYKVLRLLAHPAPKALKKAPPAELLQWGLENWDLRRLRNLRQVS